VQLELDHVFVCTAAGAPEAEKLVQFGLHEGSPNRHPGQGTACRRFAFAGAMIELLWVSDQTEAKSPATSRTLLWERWFGRNEKASPFGICLRPVDAQASAAPFCSWEYRPIYLPHPLSMSIGEAGLEEPMWVYMSFMRRIHREQHFIEHPVGIREITALTLTAPVPLESDASQKAVESGILRPQLGTASVLELEFDGGCRKERTDFRPHLPIIFAV